MKDTLQIAIDGPVASGSSTTAAKLAEDLGITFFNTGAMYRALTLACLRQGVRPHEVRRVLEVLQKVTITVEQPSHANGRMFIVRLNSEDVTPFIHAPGVSRAVPKIAAIPEVREVMVARQQALVKGRSVVMEGRDIGLRVLPQADLKIYLTARLEKRAKRRWLQYQKKGIQKTLEAVTADIKERDVQDMSRLTDPLQKLPDAWELDTTNMNQEQVVEVIKTELRKRHLL